MKFCVKLPFFNDPQHGRCLLLSCKVLPPSGAQVEATVMVAGRGMATCTINTAAAARLTQQGPFVVLMEVEDSGQAPVPGSIIGLDGKKLA